MHSSSSLLIQKRCFCRILSTNVWKKYFRRHFREVWLKLFVTLSRFWLLSEFGWIRLKRKICNKNLFQIMLNEVLKSCKKVISAGVKTDVKQELSELIAVSYNFQQKYLLKTWNTMLNRLVFLIWYWFAFHPAWYCPLRTGGGGFSWLNSTNLLRMAKVIYWGSLSCWLISLEFKTLSQKVHFLSRDVKFSCNTRLQFVLVHRTAQLTG